MRIELPYPAKPLWPNGGSNHNYHKINRLKQKAKTDAYMVAKPKRDRVQLTDGPLPIRITCFPKGRGPAPDRDNIIASAKAYLDGIALAIGTDDKHFAAPTVHISDKRLSKFIIEVGLQVELAAPPCKDTQHSA